MGFPILPLAELLLRATADRRGRDPSPEHAANVKAVALVADQYDQQQDARITLLERRLATLERSLDLMIRARQTIHEPGED